MHASDIAANCGVGSRVITTETCKQLRVLHGDCRKRLKLTLTLLNIGLDFVHTRMSAALKRITGELCAARESRQCWYSLYPQFLYPACNFGTASQPPVWSTESSNRLPTRSLGVQFAVSLHIATPAVNSCSPAFVPMFAFIVAVSCIRSSNLTAGSSKSSGHQTARALLGSISPAQVATQAMDVQHPNQCARAATGAEPGFASIQ